MPRFVVDLPSLEPRLNKYQCRRRSVKIPVIQRNLIPLVASCGVILATMDCVGVDGDDDDAVATIDPRLLVAVPFVSSSTYELHESFEQEQDQGGTGLASERRMLQIHIPEMSPLHHLLTSLSPRALLCSTAKRRFGFTRVHAWT